MMDGELNFNSGCIGGVRLAAQMGECPDFIIVGIRNTDREKDVFPEVITYPDGSKGGGRANEYLDFVREELIPKVEKTYRTDGFRVLYGTSNSGFTTVYALLRSPSTANAYIAASATLEVPSFLEKREEPRPRLQGRETAALPRHGRKGLPDDHQPERRAQGADRHLGARRPLVPPRRPPGCRARSVNSLVEGLRDLFDGWKATGEPGPVSETRPPG